MNSRMDKYVSDSSIKQRTKRNENLYNEVQDMNIDYVNINVNNAVELSATNKFNSTREDYHKERELNKILPKNKEKQIEINDIIEPKEDRIYDINEILKLARENKLFEDSNKKRLINTEYNILTKLDVKNLESEEMKKEDLRTLINNIYENEIPVKEKKYTKREEKELLNDLFASSEEDSVASSMITTELSKQILEKEEPVIEEQDEEIEKKQTYDKQIESEEIIDDFIEEKESNALMIAIIIVTILIMLSGLFFVYQYFFGI